MSDMVALYGFGTSGTTGGTLTVTAPAFVTVTVSKDGKTKTRTADADGVAVFKGLATGEWAVTITDGVQISSKLVEITVDYSTAITFSSANINITYPTGSVCTVTDGVTTITAPDTSGSWACVVPNAGTWTVRLNTGFYEVIDVVSGENYTIDKWYLFKDGSQYTNLTGGWSANGWTSDQPISEGTLCPDRINMYGVSGKNLVLATNNKIRLSDFTTLCISANVISTYQNYSALIVDVCTAVGKLDTTSSASVSSNGTGEQTLQIPVSALADGYILMKCGGLTDYKTDVFRIWLE